MTTQSKKETVRRAAQSAADKAIFAQRPNGPRAESKKKGGGGPCQNFEKRRSGLKN